MAGPANAMTRLLLCHDNSYHILRGPPKKLSYPACLTCLTRRAYVKPKSKMHYSSRTAVREFRMEDCYTRPVEGQGCGERSLAKASTRWIEVSRVETSSRGNQEHRSKDMLKHYGQLLLTITGNDSA